jgi:hypothetical protein
MDFKSLQDDVISARFKEAQRTQVSRWLNHRLAWVQSRQDWPWRLRILDVTYPVGAVSDESIDAGHAVSLGASYSRVLDVVDADTQGVLRWLNHSELIRSSTYITNEVGIPDGYAVYRAASGADSAGVPFLIFNRLVDTDRSYAVSALAAPTQMDADTDDPGIPEEFHQMLAIGAIATGLKRENDPTWQDLEDEFMGWMAAMETAHLPPDTPDNLQFGADDLGYEDWV